MSESIKGQFERADADRQEVLTAARNASALTKPALMPPLGSANGQNDKLPENYTSIGTRGVVNIEGRMLTALFPTQLPWFELKPTAELRYDPDADPLVLNEIQNALTLMTLQMVASLESANLVTDSNNRRTSFRSRKRQSLGQLIVTGDTLELLHDDLRMQVFRREDYITLRDATGNVYQHITRERIDPLALDDDVRMRSGLSTSDLKEKPVHERLMDIFTSVEWNPQTKVWVITQELNEKQVGKREERITPYFATPYELAPKDHYGHGFVELHIAELASLDTLELNRLDLMGLISQGLIGIDKASPVRAKDLDKPSGSIIHGVRVRGGKIEDVGTLNFNLSGEFTLLTQAIQEKNQTLGAAFLLQQASQRDAERVTAVERRQNAQELDGALGGLYAQIADDQQMPLLRRLYDVLHRKGKLPTVPIDTVEITAITGLEALTNDSELAAIGELGSMLAQLGDEGMSRINIDVLIDAMMRLRAIDVPGLIKSDEQIQAEQQRELQQAIAQQAVQSGGKVVENVAPQLVADNAT